MQCIHDVQRIIILFVFEAILVAFFHIVHLASSSELIISPYTIRLLYVIGTLCILLAYVGAIWWHEVHKERLLETASRSLGRVHYRARRWAGIVRWLTACRKRDDVALLREHSLPSSLPLDDWLLLEHVATLKPRHERERLRVQATHTAALASLSSLPNDVRKLVWQQGGFTGQRLRYLGDQIAGLDGWKTDVLHRLQSAQGNSTAPSSCYDYSHSDSKLDVVPDALMQL